MPNKPKDAVVGWDVSHGGVRRPIFAYNEEGVPVCNSVCPGTNGKRRCKSVIRMDNGRCSTHGGKTPKGPGHANFRTGKYAMNWNTGNRAEDLIAAVQDPDYLSLRQELGLNFVHIQNVLGKFEQGTDRDSWKKIGAIAEALEEIIFTSEMSDLLKAAVAINPKFAKVGTDIEMLVRLVKAGANETKLFREMNEALEVRRKLVETETKRNMLEQNHMPAEQVIFMFSEVVALVRRVFKNDVTGMRQFAGDLNNLQSLLPQTNRTVAGKLTPPEMLERRRQLAEGIINETDSEVAEFSDLSDEEE